MAFIEKSGPQTEENELFYIPFDWFRRFGQEHVTY